MNVNPRSGWTVPALHTAASDRGTTFATGRAESADGLIEGVELPDHRFMIGVQWHPERMQDDRRQQSLFRALVAEART